MSITTATTVSSGEHHYNLQRLKEYPKYAIDEAYRKISMDPFLYGSPECVIVKAVLRQLDLTYRDSHDMPMQYQPTLIKEPLPEPKKPNKTLLLL